LDQKEKSTEQDSEAVTGKTGGPKSQEEETRKTHSKKKKDFSDLEIGERQSPP